MKVKELINLLLLKDYEQEVYIFINGQAPFEIEAVGNLLSLSDILIYAGQEAVDYREKIVKALDLKFELKG